MKLFTCEYRCPEIDPNDIDPTIDPTAEPQSDYILGDLLFSTDNNTWMQTVQGNDPIGNFSVPATFQLSFDFKFNDLSSNHAVFRIDYQLPEIWLGIQDTSNRRNTNDTWGNIYSYLDQGYSTYAYSYLYYYSQEYSTCDANGIGPLRQLMGNYLEINCAINASNGWIFFDSCSILLDPCPIFWILVGFFLSLVVFFRILV